MQRERAAVRELIEAVQILRTNADLIDDRRMGGTTGAYVVALDDLEILKQKIAKAEEAMK